VTTSDEIAAAVKGQTAPQLLAKTIRERPTQTALRFKDADDWVEWTWADYADKATRIAAGLKRLGVNHGDRVAIMIRNRPEFHPIDAAGLLAGATPFSIYNSSAPEQVQYLVSHSEAVVAVVEGPAFLERFLKVRSELPSVREIVVVDDPEGLAGEGVIRLDDLLKESPVDLEQASEEAKPEDLATLVYTSGTTGPPKGAMITHLNVTWTAESVRRRYGELFEGITYLSYLPMAHVLERAWGHYGHMIYGTTVVPCPETTLIAQYLREVHPEGFAGVPRVWEKIHSGIMAALSGDPARKKAIEDAIDLNFDEKMYHTRNEVPPPELAAKAKAADGELLAPIRAFLGLDRLKITGTGAAPTPPEILKFFMGLGLPFTEGYGMTESSFIISIDPFNHVPGTVGRPMPGMTAKIAEDGEILVSGANIIPGYFKDPEKTAEAIDKDGWLHTGDIGSIDNGGRLRIIDRKKELIITAGGKNISPANIESALKSFPLIGQACVIGDERAFLTAILTLDPDVAPAWASGKGVGGSFNDLASNPDVLEQVGKEVEEANKRFSRVEQIKRWTLVPGEWLPDAEELTPTMKLKRRAIHAKYADEIQSMYS
jgi:long-chain acyl-CoA synthetase